MRAKSASAATAEQAAAIAIQARQGEVHRAAILEGRVG